MCVHMRVRVCMRIAYTLFISCASSLRRGHAKLGDRFNISSPAYMPQAGTHVYPNVYPHVLATFVFAHVYGRHRKQMECDLASICHAHAHAQNNIYRYT